MIAEARSVALALTWVCIVALATLLIWHPIACSKAPDEPSRASAIGAPAREKPFVASVLREPFHRADCKWAAKIHEGNLVGYDTREDAIADGHRPCKVCKPGQPRRRRKRRIY